MALVGLSPTFERVTTGPGKPYQLLAPLLVTDLPVIAVFLATRPVAVAAMLAAAATHLVA